MEKTTTTLNLSRSIYERFKAQCKKNFTSVTKEINKFMLREIQKEQEGGLK